MAVKTFAFCWADGVIDFGKVIPDGAIGLAEGQENMLRKKIGCSARLAYDNTTLLVPGVPESDGMKKVTAVADYIERLKVYNRHGFRAIGV